MTSAIVSNNHGQIPVQNLPLSAIGADSNANNPVVNPDGSNKTNVAPPLTGGSPSFSGNVFAVLLQGQSNSGGSNYSHAAPRYVTTPSPIDLANAQVPHTSADSAAGTPNAKSLEGGIYSQINPDGSISTITANADGTNSVTISVPPVLQSLVA